MDENRTENGYYTYKNYDLNVTTISPSTINYTITSHYCKDNCLITEYKDTNEDKETTFTITYENNHWLVTNYTYHDI